MLPIIQVNPNLHRRKRTHRAWRERKAHVGELVQLDGSHHDWFEGRGARCVRMAYIDDASSRVYARFYADEGTIPEMDSFQRYVQQYGIALAIYADTHTTYQSPASPSVEEQLAGVMLMSQSGRALGELGVELIRAHSPQAKGRVERLFHTFSRSGDQGDAAGGRLHAGGGESVSGGLSANSPRTRVDLPSRESLAKPAR